MTGDFYNKTQKMFKSCKRAFANIEAVEGSRSVWGDFTSRKQAAEAENMWMMAFCEFSPKLEAKVEGKVYRVAITF